MIRPLTQLSAGLVLAMALLNAHAESEAPETLPLIDSQQAQAGPVTDIPLGEIPFGASKVVLAEQDNATLYVWPTPEGRFEFTPLKGDLGAVKQFDANLGYNWRFERDGKRWQARRVDYQSQYEEEFDRPYDRLTRGNPVLKEIGLFNEPRMIECLQTRRVGFSKNNNTYTRDEAVKTFAGRLGGLGADTITKPGWEDLKACSPGLLTSLLYLDKEKYPNLFKIGLTEGNLEQAYLIGKRADAAEERADEWEEINKKLSGG